MGDRPIAAETGRPPMVVQLLGPSAGGIRAHVAELVRQTESLGWRSTVAGPAGVMEGVGPQHMTLGTNASWSPTGLVGIRRQLRRQVKGAALVHAHGLKAAAVALLTRRRVPVVVTLHNDVVGTYVGLAARVRAIGQGLLLRRADQVVFVSQAGAEAHRSLVPDARRTVMMSFAARPTPTVSRAETRARLGVAESVPLVAVVARLHPQKDIAMFLHAFALVVATSPDARAVVAGDGPQRDELVALRDELGLSEAVHFLGRADAVADLLAAADVLAISSRWEAGPIVAVEAMQLGVAVVMTDTGAVAEVARVADAASVVAVGDLTEFAAAMGLIVSDPDRRERLATRGRSLADTEFDASVLAHQIDAVYRRASGRSPIVRMPPWRTVTTPRPIPEAPIPEAPVP